MTAPSLTWESLYLERWSFYWYGVPELSSQANALPNELIVNVYQNGTFHTDWPFVSWRCGHLLTEVWLCGKYHHGISSSCGRLWLYSLLMVGISLWQLYTARLISWSYQWEDSMMMAQHGNCFHITDPLWRETTESQYKDSHYNDEMIVAPS